MARFVRLGESQRQAVRIEVDGQPVQALEGDTLMVAMLTHSKWVRHEEFSGGTRAGFCLMGACQDCWVWTPAGERLRACSTTVSEGLSVITQPVSGAWTSVS